MRDRGLVSLSDVWFCGGAPTTTGCDIDEGRTRARTHGRDRDSGASGVGDARRRGVEPRHAVGRDRGLPEAWWLSEDRQGCSRLSRQRARDQMERRGQGRTCRTARPRRPRRSRRARGRSRRRRSRWASRPGRPSGCHRPGRCHRPRRSRRSRRSCWPGRAGRPGRPGRPGWSCLARRPRRDGLLAVRRLGRDGGHRHDDRECRRDSL